MKKKRFLLTSALPYANGPLHFGHIAGAFLPADVFARFQRLQGHDVLYISGSDEYGLAVTISAELEGVSPQEHVEKYHREHRAFLDQVGIEFDHFSRTTWPGHDATVQKYFLDLLSAGYIEKKETLELFSKKENRFLADRYVQGICPKCDFDKARGDECPRCGASYEARDLKEPRSKTSADPLTLQKTSHWFVRFDAFKEKLTHWIETKSWKPQVMHFAKNYISDLHSRAITRDSTWGVKIPLENTEGKVFYVWFDAPIGYISATKQWALQGNSPSAWKTYWCDPETVLVHFIGKDNIPFHAIFFPAMTMGQNEPYKLVDELPANEFLNLEGKKFSKSDNWTIDLDLFFTHFSAEQLRYYLASIAPETQDSEFTFKGFQHAINADLVGKYGNLAQRVLVFIAKQWDGVPPAAKMEPQDHLFLESLRNKQAEVATAYETFSLRKATQHIMELASLGNGYFDRNHPWALCKEGNDVRAKTVLYCSLECLKYLAIVSYPIIPKTASALWSLLGLEGKPTSWNVSVAKKRSDGQLPAPVALCARIEDEVIEQCMEKLQGESTKMESKDMQATHKPIKEAISFDQFTQLDVRVAVILQVEKVAKSEKLLKLRVSLGFEERTIVSGIAKSYPDPEVLVNKKVAVVVNLKPALIMGIESQGMIMAADCSNGSIELVEFRHSEPGDVIR